LIVFCFSDIKTCSSAAPSATWHDSNAGTDPEQFDCGVGHSLLWSSGVQPCSSVRHVRNADVPSKCNLYEASFLSLSQQSVLYLLF